jgi:tRNA threonylcarbamoyladenosine modification (KEOPS) complex Cgi121 subunit
MPRGEDAHSACWAVAVPREELEALLAKTREGSPGVLVQVINSTREPNPAAVEMIATQTLMAARSGSTLAERPELDLLLRLAGTRQIGEAFRRLGYKSSAKRFFMVAASESGPALARMGERLAADKRFTQLARRALEEDDLQEVERAALLAAKL